MKNRFMTMLALLMALVLTVGAVPATAAAQKASIITEKLYSYSGVYLIELKNWTYDEEIISVKSSNSKVLKVIDKKYFRVEVKAAGKAKITIRYKLNDVAYTTAATFTVVKYPSPIKSLRVDGKAVSLKGNARVAYDYWPEGVEEEKVSVTINLTPASGWTISRIKAYQYNAYKNSDVHYALTVRNNRRFTVKRNYEAVVTYVLKNKKGDTFKYAITVCRPGE